MKYWLVLKILYKVFYNHTLNVSKPSKTRLFNRKNKLHYSKTKPIFHGNRVHIWQLRAWSVCQISRNTVRHHKQRVTRPLYCILLRGGHGGGGGTQVPNTAIPYEEMVNTEIPCRKWTKYRYRSYDRWRLLNVVSISRVFFLSELVYKEMNLSLSEETWEDLELIGTKIEKPGDWMPYQFYHRITARNCVFIYR